MPRCFAQIVDMTHLYPLWAAAFQADVERFAVDSASTDDMELQTWQTGGTASCPAAKFVEAELTYVLGKLNERST